MHTEVPKRMLSAIVVELKEELAIAHLEVQAFELNFLDGDALLYVFMVCTIIIIT